ncbi:unnamed protein product [Aureobasidium uvarum]|uniref:BRCT domain-containing protein n=1 Tax=Aureobasidium uvarum TaxID=2773716 RepID=A0A9N8KAR4_9PEZI|nr:unnamed protein product [Aureobasidium uvarum]
MPKSKAPTHTEHNVYLTTSVTFDNKADDFGRLQVYQAFTSLDEANEFCVAKADELALALDIEAPEPKLSHYTNDGAFRMELPLKKRNRDVVVETLIMPLMGGIIMHDKPVSRKTPKSTKASRSNSTKSKAKKSQVPGEEDEDNDHDVDMDSDPVSPKTTKTTTRKNSKASSTAIAAEQRDSVVDPNIVTEDDIAAAPSGKSGCLNYGSYTIIGHHKYWSEAQFKVIVKTFGGKVNKTLPVYNNDPTHTLVLGSDAPSRLLGRIAQKEFKPVTPDSVIAQIGYMSGPDAVGRITSEEVAKLCKKVPGKPVARTRTVKKEESDSDVDVKDANGSDFDEN